MTKEYESLKKRIESLENISGLGITEFEHRLNLHARLAVVAELAELNENVKLLTSTFENRP